MFTKLDIEPFRRAIASLEAAMLRAEQTPTDDIVRDACIQRFEYTYELSHKMLKRFLQARSASPSQFDAMPFADLVRTGSDQGLLLSDWPRWKAYRDARSMTSHTYDEDKARRVFETIPAFLQDARFLRDRLDAALA